jgi:hypothetical protein
MQDPQELQKVQEKDTFRENPLIAALFPDSDPPNHLELEGYLGRGSRRRYVRFVVAWTYRAIEYGTSHAGDKPTPPDPRAGVADAPGGGRRRGGGTRY